MGFALEDYPVSIRATITHEGILVSEALFLYTADTSFSLQVVTVMKSTNNLLLSRFQIFQSSIERPPLFGSSLKSIYHVRNVDAYRMKCLSRDRLDVMISHDWPLGIEQHGNTAELLRRKPFFRSEVEQNSLGSPPNREILDTIRPKWWFSAHLHTKFKATITHNSNQDATPSSDSKNLLSLVPSQVPGLSTTSPASKRRSKDNNDGDAGLATDTDASTSTGDVRDCVTQEKAKAKTEFHSVEGDGRCGAGVNGQPDLTDLMTQFLALDKCLPRRHYLSVLHVPMQGEGDKSNLSLKYDLEWLAVLKKTHELTSADKGYIQVPNKLAEITNSDIEWVRNRLQRTSQQEPRRQEEKDFNTIPTTFHPTVPIYSDPVFLSNRDDPFPWMGNPQTDEFLKLLELDHIITIPYSQDQTTALSNIDGWDHRNNSTQSSNIESVMFQKDVNEIDIDSDEGNDEDGNNLKATTDNNKKSKPAVAMMTTAKDENEIDIDIDVDASDREEELEGKNDKKAIASKKVRLA